MTVRTAQEEALWLLARARGLLEGSASSAVPPEARDALRDELRRWAFRCPQGCATLAYEDLEGLPLLACPSCNRALQARSASERVRAASPAGSSPSGSGLAHTLHEGSDTGAGVAAPAPSAPPRRLGEYRLLEELGRGAAGVVYRAQRGALPRPFALKVLLHHDDDPHTLGRFELEAHVAARLDHPGIVAVIDAGREGEFPYLVMEHCAGPTLKSRLRAGKLAPAEAAALVRDLAEAIAYAHGEGVLHRDLKPANVILDERSGRPRITDFGLARDRSLRTSLTQSGDHLGTPLYMSPEQCHGQRDLDGRADVWALGVILYECLTGQRPFVGSTAVQLFMKITSERPAPPRDLDPSLPGDLERIVLRALERDRASRTPDAATLAAELSEWLEARSTPTPPARVIAGWSPWVVLAGSVVAGAVVVAAAALVAISAPRPAPPPPRAAVAPPQPYPTPPPESPADPAPSTAPSASPGPTSVATPGRPGAADDAELTRLAEATTFNAHRTPPEALRAAWRELPNRLPPLAARYPRDPRVRFLQTYRRLLARTADDLSARRALLSAARATPRLPEQALGLLIHVHHTLGFQRAAGDLLEPLVAGGRVPDAFAGLALLHVTMKSAPPVRDMPRTVEITNALIRVRERSPGRGDRLLVPSWDLYANLAEALVALDRMALAAEAYRKAADVQPDPKFAAWLRETATKTAAGRRKPRDATRNVSFAFGNTRLTRLMALLQRREERSEVDAAQRAEAAAEQLLARRRPAEAALLLVRAGRAWERGGRLERSLRPLRRAHALGLGQRDRDVRWLAARVLARLLLAQPEPERHAREALSVAAVACAQDPAGSPDLRTRGEWADAWVLLARAALHTGDRARARQAAAEARRRRPYDRRALDALSALLR